MADQFAHVHPHAALAGRDPDFLAEWERTSPARAFAIELIGSRADHGLTQDEPTRILELDLSVVNELELGEEIPSAQLRDHIASRIARGSNDRRATVDQPDRTVVRRGDRERPGLSRGCTIVLLRMKRSLGS